MSSKQKAARSSTQNSAKCIHIASSSGKCQCKLEMEKNFEDFVKLSTDAFDKQSQVNVNKKTKELTEFSESLLRQNFELRKDNLKVENMEKIIEKLKVASAEQTKELNTSVENLSESTKELKAVLDGLTERIKHLEVEVAHLTERNNNVFVTGQNEEFLVPMIELHPTIDEIQNRMKAVEDKVT